MSGPELCVAFNQMAKKIKKKGVDVTPVKRFKTHAIGVERCNKLEAKLLSAGTRSPAKVGKTASERTKRPTRTPKPKFGHDKTIVKVGENVRFKGSKAYRLFEQMSKWVEKNKGKSIAQLFAETDYRRQDYDWDLKRESIEVRSIAS
jgi:hypothetical protein